MTNQPSRPSSAGSASKPWEGQLAGLANVLSDSQHATLDLAARPQPAPVPCYAQPKRPHPPMPPTILSASATADQTRVRMLSPRMQLVVKAAAAVAANHVRSGVHVRGVREAQRTARPTVRPSSAPVSREPPSSHVPATARTAAEAAAALAPADSGQLGQLVVVGQLGHHLPATARTSGEHQRLWKHKWRSKQSARDRGDAQFFEQVKTLTDRDTQIRGSQYSAFRDLGNERQNELLLLQSELQLLRQQVRADGGESERQHARIAELEQQASLAEAQAEEEEESTLCRQYMRARLSKRRPHLEKRLAFLRSKLIVATVDHERLNEVMEVALAYEGRIAEQLVKAKERAAAQRVANDERRNRLRDELADSSTARRMRQIEAMKQRPGGANEQVMAGLKQMVQLEHHEGRVSEI